MRKILFLPIASLALFFTTCNNDKGETGNSKREDKETNNRDEENKRDDRDDESNDSRSSIVGKWRIIDIVRDGEKSTASREEMSKMTAEFTRSGKYYSRDGEDVEDGTYTFNEKTGVLITTPENGGEEEQVEIEFLGRNKMQIIYPQGKITLERY